MAQFTQCAGSRQCNNPQLWQRIKCRMQFAAKFADLAARWLHEHCNRVQIGQTLLRSPEASLFSILASRVIRSKCRIDRFARAESTKNTCSKPPSLELSNVTHTILQQKDCSNQHAMLCSLPPDLPATCWHQLHRSATATPTAATSACGAAPAQKGPRLSSGTRKQSSEATQGR